MPQSLVVAAFKESDAPTVAVLVGATASLGEARETEPNMGG
jgi:hypothetical protein